LYPAYKWDEENKFKKNKLKKKKITENKFKDIILNLCYLESGKSQVSLLDASCNRGMELACVP